VGLLKEGFAGPEVARASGRAQPHVKSSELDHAMLFTFVKPGLIFLAGHIAFLAVAVALAAAG
jgi:hypothetical protein